MVKDKKTSVKSINPINKPTENDISSGEELMDRISDSIKHMAHPANFFMLLGFFSILISLWVILYALPNIFVSLFHTFLGNFILIIAVIIVGMINVRAGIAILILFVVLYQFYHYAVITNTGERIVKEGFTDVKNDHPLWSDDTVKKFLKYKSENLPKSEYNMDVLQQQASEPEVRSLINTGSWNWSKFTQELFKESIASNTDIRIEPGEALKNAMKIYNNSAAKQLLSWQTKEGRFLLDGVQIKQTEIPNLFPNSPTTIKCSEDKNGRTIMQKTVHTGTDYFTGYKNYEKTTVENADIPSEIPGFSFLSAPCNPCVALNEKPEYNCPFTFKNERDKKDTNKVSAIWASLWNKENI